MIRQLLKYASPIVVSRLTNVLLSIISTVIVAHLGLNELAAYGLTYPIYLTFYLILISYLLVFSVRAAQYREDKEQLGGFVIATILFASLLSLVMIVIFCLIPRVLPLLGQAPDVIHLASQFFYFIVFGVPPLLFAVVLNQLLIILHRSIFVIIVQFSLLIVGVFLVYLFSHIYGLGVKGVAIGFSITYWLKFIVSSVYLLIFCREQVVIKSVVVAKLLSHIKFLLGLGWPVSLQYGSELIAGAIVLLMIGHLYPDALAAQQAVTQLRVFFIMIAFSLSQASVILTAKSEMNAQRVMYINRILKLSLLLGVSFIIISMIVANLFSSQYIGLFLHTENAKLITITKLFLLITSVALVFDMVKYLFSGVLRGLEDTRRPMYLSFLSCFLFGLCSSYGLGYYTDLTVIGIRLGMLLGLLVNVGLLIIYYFRKTRLEYIGVE